MAAIDDLTGLIQSLPGYSSITPSMKNSALAGSLVPDSEGRWPGQDDYVPTYDVFYAAYSLVGFLQAQPMVTHTNSEATSVTVSRPDWGALLRYYSGQSVVLGAGRDVLQIVPIPDTPHIYRVDMRGEGSYGAGIDTDLG